jgi:hypothetical protein
MVSEGENWKLAKESQREREDNSFRNFNSMTQNTIKETREPLKEKITSTSTSSNEYENLHPL